MCGPSGPTSNEINLQKSSQTFATQLQQNYGQLFSQQQGVLSAINRSLNPILSGGPSQHGFSPEMLASLNTGAINAAGAANRMAQQAARTYGAGQGSGGASGVTSGITKQIESAIGSQSANALAAQQNQIVQADFSQGNANYWRAQGGLSQLASEYNPNAAESGTLNANQQAYGQEKDIQQQRDARGAWIGGLVASAIPFAGKGLASGFANLDTQGTSTGGEQAKNFASGFFGGLG